jgi:hypothetical protein
MTPAQAKQQRADRIERRRDAEALCAWDFLTNGDLRGAHADRCVRPAGLLCSRDYDPGPPPEDERMYDGAALGTLWGLNDTAAWQLAGWNITRRRAAA